MVKLQEIGVTKPIEEYLVDLYLKTYSVLKMYLNDCMIIHSCG